MRPDRLVVVAGTGTEVGKTWAGARALAAARQAGVVVAARKPIQSFDTADPAPTDAKVLAAATGEEVERVCPGSRWLGVAMAPPMAAEVLGVECPTLDELVGELAWAAGVGVGLVETVGGVRSPLATDGDSAELVHRLEPDLVLLVADATLGTINLVRLSLEALAPWPVRVLLNRFDPGDDLQVRNRDWLRDHDGCDVLTTADRGWEGAALS